jgi:hypothetical protein
MKIALMVISMLASAGSWAADQWYVSSADWAQPRNGDALVRHPGLGAAVDRLMNSPGSSLELHYAGGDDGLLWASELRGWLIALGVGSPRIELVPGGGRGDRIELRVVEHPVGAGTYP